MITRNDFKISIAVAVSITMASCAAGPPKTPPRPDKDNHIKLDNTAQYFSDDGLVTRKVLQKNTWNVTLSREFKTALSAHPAALSEANKIKTYSGITTGGALALLAISVKSLADTLDQADDLDNGEISDDSSQTDILGPLAAVAGVLLFASIRGKQVLKNSVDIYNKKQDALSAANNHEHRTVAGIKPRARSGYSMTVGGHQTKNTADRRNSPRVMANWSVQF